MPMLKMNKTSENHSREKIGNNLSRPAMKFCAALWLD